MNCLVLEGQKPPSDWPARGEIRIHNLFLRYGEEEPVLKDISLGIKSMEKVRWFFEVKFQIGLIIFDE